MRGGAVHPQGARGTGRWPDFQPVVVAVVGVLVFGVLSVLCWMVADANEQRLLQEHTEQAGAVLSVSIGEVRGPLEGAARAARTTHGDPDSLDDMVAPLMADTGVYASFALFDIDSTTPVARLGSTLRLLEHDPDGVEAVFDRVRRNPFVVVDLLDVAEGRTLGFAAVDDAESPRYVVYAERVLRSDPHVRTRFTPPFSRLEYAQYLGGVETSEMLLGATTADLPIRGHRAETVVPYGDTEILLVAGPIGTFGGWLMNELWWIVAVSGLLGTASIVMLLRRLDASRNHAIELAAESAAKHVEQREIAETLQLGLLPRRLATPPGTSVASRYWPAGSVALIGGDFYDLFTIGEQTWGITIGDVCGKGIDAAALTGLSRHTIRTAARSGLLPSDVLHAVHTAMADHEPATFCTACFITYTPSAAPPASADLDDDRSDRDGSGQDSSGQDGIGAGEVIGRLVVALGGHPPPLRCRAGSVEAIGRPGSILGLIEPRIVDVTVDVRVGDTLVLYTDGLTDAPRHEAVPLHEIEHVIAHHDGDVDDLADSIRQLKRRRRPAGSSDDTAVLIIRFDAATDRRSAHGPTQPTIS